MKYPRLSKVAVAAAVLTIIGGILIGGQGFIYADDLQWQCIGPEGGNILSLAQNALIPNEMYASLYGNPGAIYKTDDFGENWEMISMIDSYPYHISCDPVDMNTLYVTSGSNVYKSVNGGLSWDCYSLGSASMVSQCPVIVHPINTDTIYTAGYYRADEYFCEIAFFKSTDGGQSWAGQFSQTGHNSVSVTALAIDPANPEVLYCCAIYSDIEVDGYMVLKSVNGGDLWTDITGTISSYPSALIIDPVETNRIYVSAGAHVYSSSNGGASWTQNNGYISANVLLLDSTNRSTIYGAANGNFYKSTDYGLNWTPFNRAYSGDPSGLKMDEDGNLLLGGNAGFFSSSDSGANWQQSNSGLQSVVITSMALSPSSPGDIRVNAEECGLLHTPDTGTNWEQFGGPENCSGYNRLIVNPYDNDIVYIIGGP